MGAVIERTFNASLGSSYGYKNANVIMFLIISPIRSQNGIIIMQQHIQLGKYTVVLKPNVFDLILFKKYHELIKIRKIEIFIKLKRDLISSFLEEML